MIYGACVIEVSRFMTRVGDSNYTPKALKDQIIVACTQVHSHSGLIGKVRFIMVTFCLSYCMHSRSPDVTRHYRERKNGMEPP